MENILITGKISRIEDHGTVVIAWLEENGKESPVYFDHRQFQTLVNNYGENLEEEEFVYAGKVMWTIKEVV